ncbi:MAG: MBL fold metallo-hydrolase [Patescibacteria group bacterium]|nr:MBL fold metallo-hydrolase [Patescibacteria group bacterium]
MTFCSGAGTVTGANFLLEVLNGKKLLVDCGLIQGERFADEINRQKFIYEPAAIDALLVTHAHLDHVGRIPKLAKEGFKGPIYSTPQTMELAQLVLDDAVGILANEARDAGREPLYGEKEVSAVWNIWHTINYHELAEIVPGVSVFLKDAGHILGSAMVEFTVTSAKSDGDAMKILFTGDLGNSPAPLLRDTESVGDVDYLVMESTYGDRNHEPKEERSAKFETIINEAVNRGGTLVVPTFSIDRTQVLLYELNNLVEQGKIRPVPIFLDSPMAIAATKIYRSNEALFNDEAKGQIARGDDIFAFPKLEFTVASRDSREIEKQSGPKIILAGSGMSVGGRVIGHEVHYLPDPKSTILLVGYQSTGSLGRELAEGAKKVRIHGEDVRVRARIETLYGYSAHKDSDHLLEFVATASDRLKKVFVVMGEPKASMYLAQRINGELKAEAMAPEVGTVFDL